MIDRKDFSNMAKELQRADEVREQTIALSREIIRLSKKIIYSVHRDDLAAARSGISEIRSKVRLLKEKGDASEGHFRTAMQEYVEAACLFSFAESKRLPTKGQLGVEAEHYLLGICDLSGELVRLAINSAVKGDADKAMFIKDFLNELYGELLNFDFRNGDLRRKFDGIKYDLQKLEDLAFELSGRK